MMSPDMAPDAWNLRSRIPRARRYLSSLPTDEITRAIVKRLAGVRDSFMPPLERFEDGADIFIDVALQPVPDYADLPDRIRAASAALLQQFSQQSTLENIEVIGEAIFLAARIEAESAISGISALVTRDDSTKLLSNGEQLRSRGLRALFGLLIRFPGSRDDVREVFERFKFSSANVDICVPALVAIYGQDLDSLLEQAKQKGLEVPRQQVLLQLRAAGLN